MTSSLRAQLRAVHRGQTEVPEHAALLLRVAEEAKETVRGLSMQGVAGAPDWYDYELLLWEISEDFRAYLRSRKAIRGAHPLLDAAAEIVADTSYGKGRQNFVLVLGQYGGVHYADVIASGLGDPDVSAQALRALRKMKDGRFVEEARSLENDPPTPATRTEARSYLRALISPS
jgi:hypothetical protein